MSSEITEQKLTRLEHPNGIHLKQRPNRTRGVQLDHHYNAVPVCASPLAWCPPDSKQKLTRNPDGATTVPGSTANNGMSAKKVSTMSEFRSRFRRNSEELLDKQENARFPYEYSNETDIPSDLLGTLRHLRDTFGETLAAVHKHWPTLHGFGEKRVTEVLYSDFNSTGTPTQHVSMTTCSQCNSSFWQFVPENIPPSDLIYQSKVYCPLCFSRITDTACISHETINVSRFYPPEITESLPEVAPHI